LVRVIDHTDELVDALKVVCIVEVNEGGLPELFCVAGGSHNGETSSFNLLLPLLERREFLVVVFKVFPEEVELVLDVFVDPGFLLELEDQIQRVDHRQVLKAAFIRLEVVEKHAYNAHDFLLVEVIKDFSNTLNDADLIVSEEV